MSFEYTSFRSSINRNKSSKGQHTKRSIKHVEANGWKEHKRIAWFRQSRKDNLFEPSDEFSTGNLDVPPEPALFVSTPFKKLIRDNYFDHLKQIAKGNGKIRFNDSWKVVNFNYRPNSWYDIMLEQNIDLWFQDRLDEDTRKIADQEWDDICDEYTEGMWL